VVEIWPIAKAEPSSIIGALKGSVLKYDRPFDPAFEALWDAEQEGPWGPRK
jgi:hypothetical protein